MSIAIEITPRPSDIVIEELDIQQPGALKALLETVKRFWPAMPAHKDYNGTRDWIIIRLEDHLANRKLLLKSEKIALSFANGKLQGIMIYDTDEELDSVKSWKVNDLLSAPWNVLKTADRCKEACRALITYLTKRADTTQIHLSSTPSAQAFYKSMQFVRKGYNYYVRNLPPPGPSDAKSS